MKKIIFTLIFSLFLLQPRLVEAAAECTVTTCRCNDITVENATLNSEVTNRFTFKAAHCDDDYTYHVEIGKTINGMYETLFPVSLDYDYCYLPNEWCLQNESAFPLNSTGSYRALLIATNITTGVSTDDRIVSFSVTEIDTTGDEDEIEEGTSPREVLCGPGSAGVQSAIGCIPFGDTFKLAAGLANAGVGLGGGTALILIGISSFKISRSEGSPQSLNESKELLMGAISGIIMLIISASILNFLGVKILGLF